ncbi:MAG: hypothetical protein QM762_01190 [Chryseolinea sp.]
MKTKVTKIFCVACAIILFTGRLVIAQELMDSVTLDESKIVAAIAPYSQEMRTAILTVAGYPQVLVKLSRMQARSSQSFRDMVESYPRDVQEKFYQVTRFPDLNKRLVNLGSGQSTAAEAIIDEAPEGVRANMRDVYSAHFDQLVKFDKLYKSSQSTFDRITSRYPGDVKDAFSKVVANPDVMNLLADNIDLTVSLGDAYKSDPRGVTASLDSLNKQLDVQNATDLADYKQAVEKDPKLRDEMEQAASEFAQQYDETSGTPAVANNNYYGTSPYPYWFGYPYWYNMAMWYPMPYYYNTGFYFGLNGSMVVFGMPSYAYANWFFGYGYHHYPNLYRYYNSYYNVHRANVLNSNVYRGFNTVAREHFNNLDPVHTRSLPGNYRAATGLTGRSNSAATVRQPVSGSQFSGGHFNHFNANTYHNMSWQRVPSGGFHGSPGMNGGFHGGMSVGMHGHR